MSGAQPWNIIQTLMVFKYFCLLFLVRLLDIGTCQFLNIMSIRTGT